MSLVNTGTPMENMESIQLFNTAIIKSKQRVLGEDYEERLRKICSTPVIDALSKAVVHLSDSQKISRDQAATQIITTFRDLDAIWQEYVMMEGIDKLKGILSSHQPK